MIYFDNASTTKPKDEVLATYDKVIKRYYANPSGVHLMAREVDKLQDQSRNELLKLFNYQEGTVIFTSSATEANNIALIGLFLKYKNRGNEIITSPYEHPSVRNVLAYLKAYHGAVIREVSLLPSGEIDLQDLSAKLTKETVVVTIMAVNNEIGFINDLRAISTLLRSFPKVIFHSDISQAIGKVAIPFNELDAFSFSAHKIGGLKGSGALIMRKKLQLFPLLHGGDQEGGYRAGTSNAPVNIVLAKTVRLALESQNENFRKVEILSGELRSLLLTEETHFKLISTTKSTYIVNFVPLTVQASVVLNALENESIVIGTTSSCSAKIHSISQSVFAFTNNEYYANNALRVSFSSDNTLNEVHQFFNNLMKIVRGNT